MKWIIDMVRSGNTVFSYADMAHFFEWKDKQDLVNKVHYAVRRGYLHTLSRWIFALAPSWWNKYEFANKILTPSYISLQSALRIHGINFQYEQDIYAVSYKSCTITTDIWVIHFHSMKKSIRENYAGVGVQEWFSLASRERAVLDTLYLYGEYYFDNLSLIDWNQAATLLPIYGSKILKKRFTLLRQHHDTDYRI